jgi:hypothetical protein
MRAYHRGIVVAVVITLGLGVAGCESLPDFENMFNTKKRLPGERKEVFPGGVPGVTQGVPPELMKGNQAAVSVDGATPAAATAEVPAAAAPPPEKPKPAAKKRVAAKPKPAPAAPAEPQAQPSQPASGAWPAQAPAAQSKPAAGSVWPDAPPTGTFSR